MDIRQLKVYVISVGTGKYEKRLQSTLQRLQEKGFQKVEHVKSVFDPNPTNSLSLTNLLIFEKEKYQSDPFLIIEDDVEFEQQQDNFIFTIPPNASAIYIGVSLWIYPHDYHSLMFYRQHIRPIISNDVSSYNEQWVEIKGMTSAHAILYLDRTFINHLSQCIQTHLPLQTPHDLILATIQKQYKVYALKQPIMYQEEAQGGQEDVTRLCWNGTLYTKRK